MTTKKIIQLPEVAEMLGVDHETARRWAVSGRIPAFRYDERGRWKVYREDIDEWIRERQTRPKTGQVDSATQ
jgi:excisionase family DNA binding protein